MSMLIPTLRVIVRGYKRSILTTQIQNGEKENYNRSNSKRINRFGAFISQITVAAAISWFALGDGIPGFH